MTGQTALSTTGATSTLLGGTDRRRSLRDVLTTIETTSYEPLRQELAAILALLDDELRRHPGADDETLQAICMTLRRLQTVLSVHFDVEESQLIPSLWLYERGIRSRSVQVTAMVGQLGYDQFKIMSLLCRLQVLVRLYRRPDRKSPAVSAALAGLAALTRGVHAHLRRETRVLLPRLAALADAMGS
jgi:iron-sulfur cluster repair protein YtfE (RIC family)